MGSDQLFAKLKATGVQTLHQLCPDFNAIEGRSWLSSNPNLAVAQALALLCVLRGSSLRTLRLKALCRQTE